MNALDVTDTATLERLLPQSATAIVRLGDSFEIVKFDPSDPFSLQAALEELVEREQGQFSIMLPPKENRD